MKEDFDWCVQHTIDAYEGGYNNDPHDPGGPTNFGITIRDYAQFMGHPVTANDVQQMPRQHAVRIYEIKYGPGIHFQDLNRGIDYVMFDYAVHSGIARPIRVVQSLLRLPVTGKLDAKTLASVNAANQTWLINAVCRERDHFLQQIRGGTQYKRYPGWGKRVADVNRVGLALLTDGQQLPTRVETLVAEARGVHGRDPVKARALQAGSVGVLAASQVTHAWLSSDIAIALGAVVLGVVIIGFLEYYQNLDELNNRVDIPLGFAAAS